MCKLCKLCKLCSRSYGNVRGTLTTGTGMFQPAKWASPYSDLANRRQHIARPYSSVLRILKHIDDVISWQTGGSFWTDRSSSFSSVRQVHTTESCFHEQYLAEKHKFALFLSVCLIYRTHHALFAWAGNMSFAKHNEDHNSKVKKDHQARNIQTGSSLPVWLC